MAKLIVAITSCPTGIAHTYMAAEAIEQAAKKKGYEVKVETQGSVGAENELTAEEIARADGVIIAADTKVDDTRFVGKPVVKTGTGDAIKNAEALIDQVVQQKTSPVQDVETVQQQQQAERPRERRGVYQHLMTGVSYMIPFVVAGGLLIALSFMFGIHAAEEKGTLAAALKQIGGETAFALMVPVLAGFIAFSIADRPGIAPGLVGGMLASQIGSGFLGGIVAGFLAGYVALGIKKHLKLPATLEGLKPVLIIPLFSVLIVGLLMIYVIGTPMAAVTEGLTRFLQGMQAGSAVVLGLLLGAMMAFDVGGPLNKAAYTFGITMLEAGVQTPMAAVMAAGMTPPLGLALATFLRKNRFTRDEREAGKAAVVLGASFITEGAIPFAAKDPLRVIPSIMIGSAVTGALSMWFNVTLVAPHGGVFVFFIPHAITHLLPYMLSIAIGTLVTAVFVTLLKKPVQEA
ncbi:PTS fructose transporter subunit IIC [Kroppenstedtia eburnea]|uniref:PTS system D-fructose-specific IIB component (F1P-forming), Frc family /PTS system D-fructose-specific IIC component (F1P-forming), Frc family n=1 Tax=Kroppenstedtia eburnea TaxID=714067 RepID=A0A1N7MD04_9BACL|nr:fructose-specific PTS transporter subunit EIIC [Kroppenstedtia eburnea]SIS83917.1 PTS system D-fructose-specific IIB component (F1P-forming), Frc family /PTS system D-fructose-specific IIC component (F1P-forming), Frc family [Kroppenstedtia eburnea]